MYISEPYETEKLQNNTRITNNYNKSTIDHNILFLVFGSGIRPKNTCGFIKGLLPLQIFHKCCL